ncbi:CdaR family transcriptional regulator [Alteribacillus sp. YIM 98480]|uniref:PucR family transcriptional regulator n=1 Tax=Alteribacillus sp. YIM 98480 TaxID=2606599 RepID=UPI00131CF24A|nr:helix-turn-helix domain-containing protein [Alteribacillus sp. YIM 98480]
MIDKLKNIFPSLLLEEEVRPLDRHLYVFLKLNENKTAAIKKDEMTEQERKVLEVFLEIENQTDSFDPMDISWYSYLIDNGPLPPLQQFPSFRFYHIEGSKLYDNKFDLQELLRSYFDTAFKCVFLHTHSLVVIVKESKDQELPAFNTEELAGIFATDLLIDVYVCSGRRVHAFEDIRFVFKQEKTLFDYARQLFPKDRAFNAYEILPFVFPLLKGNDQKRLFSYTFANLENEKELIETLYYFFLSNLNISLTAKELHMHRNTLQYRLDKITDQIGIDIKQFPNAAALFILIKRFWE